MATTISPIAMLEELSESERRSFLASLPLSDRAIFDRMLFERHWSHWVAGLFPRSMWDFSEYHRAFWDWLWKITPDQSPRPFVGLWPRAAAKSTNVELGVVALGARAIRRYCLYVSETQDQADDHVASIASLLENPTLAATYPSMARPRLNLFGNPRGWRRNRLMTEMGFTIDAMGLDSAARGAKLDEDRPDIIVLDDIDSEDDSPAETEKKIQSLTRKLLPAGSKDSVIIFMQNVVHEHSIAARLAGMVEGEEADFIHGRIVSGPHKALNDAVIEQDKETGDWQIISGTPTWAGLSLSACRTMMAKIGYVAFMVECQHDVSSLPGGMFDDIQFRHVIFSDVPPLVRTVVWVDPAVTNTDKSDSMGIQCDGLGEDGRIYRLYSWEGKTSPETAIEEAIITAYRFQSLTVGIETDQGGDTWLSVFERAMEKLRDEHVVAMPYDIGFVEKKAGAGYGPKFHRANQMHAAYQQDLFRHVVGSHGILERALRRFPRAKPYDLVDAAFWSYDDLAGEQPFDVAVGGSPSAMHSYEAY